MIYIPLCFYLYEQSRRTKPVEVIFTFHYVSTYTDFSNTIFVGDSLFTFHYVSTYTLSHRLWNSRCNVFTFHYVSTYTIIRLLTVCQINKIYIPLCFYLYEDEERDSFFYFQFTFHYVSTYTIPICLDTAAIPAFTFHYVSTYTRSVSGDALPVSDLHSTMFLLILRIRLLFHEFDQIYIPLCFYLYWIFSPSPTQ